MYWFSCTTKETYSKPKSPSKQILEEINSSIYTNS